MKTAMQELITHLEMLKSRVDMVDVDSLIEYSTNSLEKEKEQLDDMFEEGFESAYQHFVNGKDFVQFEQYYNETFKSE